MTSQSVITISQAFNKALVSCLHPKVWVAFFIPFISFIITFILLGSFLWGSIDKLIDYSFSFLPWLQNSNTWLIDVIGFGFLNTFSWLATFLTVTLIGVIIAITLSALLVTDMLMKHLHNKHYSEIIPEGVSLKADIKNTLYYAAILVITILVGLPLWFFPPLAFVWQIYWTRFFFSRSLPFDTLCNFATMDEIQSIRKKYVNPNEKMGLFCALFNYIPFAALVLPIFSILWFGHYNMSILIHERQTRA
ncbi:EI24 domain-containing protein [Thorsellia kenyensis]|uniref:EI24 domain-containing protein n=1 Tax=Thorsellia kenyensis TaxID=1549888 RepID=A0ABV6CCJ3_9GAMM